MKKYLLIYTVTLLLTGSLLFPNYLFLKHSGEISAIPDVVRAQTAASVLYGAGFVDNTYKYKLELIRQRKPDVVALGSSRVFFLQEDAFRGPFVNAGGGARSVREARLFVDDMLSFHRPKVLLLGMDYFWFNRVYPVAAAFPEHAFVETDITRVKLMQPWYWLWKDRYSFRDYWRIVRGEDLANPFVGYNSLGLFAILRGNGFRPDGSHINSWVCSGKNGEKEYGFKFSLELLTSPGWGLSVGNEVDPRRVAELADFAAACEAKGVTVIYYLTPMTKIVNDRLANDPSARTYLAGTVTALKQALKGKEFYNTLRGENYGAMDCEAIDAHHLGNVSQFRLLEGIAAANSRSALVPFLDRAKISRLIRIFAGQAMVYQDPALIKFDEVDFHRIGCVKKSREEIAQELHVGNNK